MIRIAGSAVSVLIFLLGGCGPGTSGTADEVCRGVPADMGGCDPDQPTFSEETCDGLATEFGIQLDSRMTAVIDGPASVNNNGKSAQALNALILTVARLNEHLRDEGLVKNCTAESVLAVAERKFSPMLRDGAGSLMTETDITGETYEYSDWRNLVLDHLTVIDEDEDLLY